MSPAQPPFPPIWPYSTSDQFGSVFHHPNVRGRNPLIIEDSKSRNQLILESAICILEFGKTRARSNETTDEDFDGSGAFSPRLLFEN